MNEPAKDEPGSARARWPTLLSRRRLRYSLMALLVIQILLALGFWLYFQYHRGSNYPLAVCGVGYGGLILVLIAGWWLLPVMLPRPIRSKPLAMLLAGVAGCLAVALIFPHLRPAVTVVQNPEFPTLEGLADGSEDAQKRQKAEAKRLRLPVEIVNTVGIRFRFIPAGEFMMGSPEDEVGRREKEVRHRVVLTQPFYIGATEVTQNQWQTLMDTNPSYHQGDTQSGEVSAPEILPVESVSREDCQTYIQRLCEKEWVPNGTYRLPSEAEWEYTCRAGTIAAFYAGACTEPGGVDPVLEHIGWYGDNSRCKRTYILRNETLIPVWSSGSTSPVGQKAGNSWGLYDTSGNVLEWCFIDLGDRSPALVARGGCFRMYAASCRSASREVFRGGSFRSKLIGLRLVREVEPRP